jgi:hypothetical protein
MLRNATRVGLPWLIRATTHSSLLRRVDGAAAVLGAHVLLQRLSPGALRIYSAVAREKSLSVLAPEVAAQWHPTKNGDLTPVNIASQTSKRYWWQCEASLDHGWEATPTSRVGNGSGCPFCSGQKVLVTNSLASLAPEVAAEWHPTKNGDVKPADVAFRASAKYWWKCAAGPDHEWEARVASRVGSGTGCPCCKGRQVSVTNSLATMAPKISPQWYLTLNGDATPENVVSFKNEVLVEMRRWPRSRVGG